MKKLTKKQHRAAIKREIEKIEDVDDLRAVQQVAEIFKENGRMIVEEGGVLTVCESLHMLLELTADDRDRDAYNALFDLAYGHWDITNEIIEMLDKADERRLKLIFCYIRAILGLE